MISWAQDVESAGEVHGDAVENGVVDACFGEGMEIFDGLGGIHKRLLFVYLYTPSGNLPSLVMTMALRVVFSMSVYGRPASSQRSRSTANLRSA